jgi:hypothetical protein
VERAVSVAFTPRLVDTTTGDAAALDDENCAGRSMTEESECRFLLRIRLAAATETTDGLRVQIGEKLKPGHLGEARLFDPATRSSWFGRWQSDTDGLLLLWFPVASNNPDLQPLPQTSLRCLSAGTDIELWGQAPVMAVDS